VLGWVYHAVQKKNCVAIPRYPLYLLQVQP